MKTTLNAICSSFKAKTSQSGSIYYQVDLTEQVETNNPEQPRIDRTFKNLYLNIGKPIENHSEFIGRQVNAVLEIYPSDRKVGELIYQDIKMKLLHIDIL